MENHLELSGLYVVITALLVQEGAVGQNGLSSTQLVNKIRSALQGRDHAELMQKFGITSETFGDFKLEQAVPICLQTLVHEGESDCYEIDGVKHYTLIQDNIEYDD